MPSAQVKLNDRNKSFHRIVNCRHRKKRFGMCHEARPWYHQRANPPRASISDEGLIDATYLVIRSSMDRGSRIKVGRTTRLRSAPGRNCEMMCERTTIRSLVGFVLVIAAFGGVSHHFPDRAQRPRPLRFAGNPP